MQGKGDALPVGSQLQGGKYVIEAVLGQGSFGITYRAANTGSLLHKQVAIKELFVEGSQRVDGQVQHPLERSDESWGKLTANFEREAQTLARLKHPNIVTVHDAFAENGTIYIVMEFVDGTTLDQLVRQRGGKLPEDEALGYIAEIADALNVLHKNGVLHRDIKPANIIIDQPGHAMLIDFGTARDFVADKTLTHSVILTPAFAPPEQFQPRARRGPFTDIYALAATTYWLLTSEPPAMGEADAVEQDTLLSPQVRTALAHALAFNSYERTQDAATFIRELLGPSAQPAATPPPNPEATTSVAGYQRNAALPSNATTVPNRPAPAFSEETQAEQSALRSAQPRPFTASELTSQPLSAETPRRPWLAIAGGVAAVVLLAVLAILLSGIGKNTNTAGGANDTPTIMPVAGITQTVVVVAQAQATTTPVSIDVPVPTDTPAMPTATLLPPTATELPPTATALPPTPMPVLPTATFVPPTNTRIPPTNIPVLSTNTPVPPTATRKPPSSTPAPPTHIPVPQNTPVSPTATPQSASAQSAPLSLNGIRLQGIYMVSAYEGWAVGGGTILHYSDSSWTKVSSLTGDDINSVAMVSANEGWAVGNNGTILHCHSGTWTQVGSPTNTDINSVYMVSANEGWAVGGYTTLHFSDGRWTKASIPSGEYLYSVAMVSANEGWAGGASTILHYSGGSWTKASNANGLYLTSVAMVSANEGWAVGYGGILHYSGGSWTEVNSPTTVELKSVAMVSSKEGWAVGIIGTVLHYSEGKWMNDNTSGDITNYDLNSVYMTSPNEGWAVGVGIILHYQNGVWSVYH